MEQEILVLIFSMYLALNSFVLIKINKALYLKEERRNIHRVLIWVIPFLGPLLIKSHWITHKNNINVMTKSKRRNKKGKNTDNWETLTGYGGGGDF